MRLQLVSDHLLRQVKPVSTELCALLDEASTSSSIPPALASALSRLRPLASAYDDIAGGRYSPVLRDVPYEVDEDDGVAVKIVRLMRNGEPLGATIKCAPDGAVLVARILKGGVADRCAAIEVGDRVIEVNGVPVGGKQPQEIVQLLATSDRIVTFKLVPVDANGAHASGINGASVEPLRVRALFDYNPFTDGRHPCAEAGLTFRRGDILELVDTSDEYWWQACCHYSPRVCADCTNVALIPSPKLLARAHFS